MPDRVEDDPQVRQWLRFAEDHREFARLANGPSAFNEHSSNANRYAALAGHRMAYLRKLRALGGDDAALG